MKAKPSELFVVMQPIENPKTNARNARTHSKRQVRQIASSIKTFGFTNPVLVDKDNTIVAGHGRVAAARCLESQTCPRSGWRN